MTKPRARVHPIVTDGVIRAAGITKREYFAVMILQGLITSQTHPVSTVIDAVKFADLLIEALNEQDNNQHPDV